MGKIFTHARMKKYQVFDHIRTQMEQKGWVRLNEGHPLTGVQSYIYFSDGEDGNKKIYVELYPFTGAQDPAQMPTPDYYDVRNPTGTASAFFIAIGSGYDETSGTLLGPYIYTNNTVRGRCISPYISGRHYTYTSYSQNSPDIHGSYEMDVWTNIDKDWVSYYLLLTNAFTPIYLGGLQYFGIPEQGYIKERVEPCSSDVIYGGTLGTIAASRLSGVLNTPDVLAPAATGYGLTPMAILSSTSPNVDQKMHLSDLYMHHANEGVRFRLGHGIYMLPNVVGSAIDGDIIEVPSDGGIKRFRFCQAKVGYNAEYTSLPTHCFAIRIS